MVGLEFEIPSAFDPFADAKQSGGAGTKEYVHIRIQQRNGKKSLTTVQGLPKELSYEKILKTLKKDFCCNGNVVQDKELGKVIQLQGDQRKNVPAISDLRFDFHLAKWLANAPQNHLQDQSLFGGYIRGEMHGSALERRRQHRYEPHETVAFKYVARTATRVKRM